MPLMVGASIPLLTEKIATMRDEITAMVVEGIPVEEAFQVAINLLSEKDI